MQYEQTSFKKKPSRYKNKHGEFGVGCLRKRMAFKKYALKLKSTDTNATIVLPVVSC